jgi:hypothetical protein
MVLLGVVLLLKGLITAVRFWRETAEGGSLTVITVGAAG